MNFIPLLIMSLTLFACNAYRSAPVQEVLSTNQDLARKGFVLAPVADLSLTDNPTVSDWTAFDSILFNTLEESWNKPKLFSTSQATALLDGDRIEAWRRDLKAEDQNHVSESSAKIYKELLRFRVQNTLPPQLLLPTLLQNTVSCGQKEAMATGLSPSPRAGKNYCQRTMKMRFRIMTADNKALLWNGLIYATQEATVPRDAKAESSPVEPPSTQALVRECFRNFARQFADL